MAKGESMGQGLNGPLRGVEPNESFKGVDEAIEFISADFSDLQRAGFQDRAWASLLDVGFIFAITCFSGVLSVLLVGQEESPFKALSVFLVHFKVVFWLGFLLGLAYCVFALWSFNQTLGKYAFGLRVLKLAPRPLRFDEVLVRELGFFLSVLPFGLGLLWPYFDEKGRNLHDHLAGTLVIKIPRVLGNRFML
jgi:uncharacterized RDD family membrane protein YckC